MHEAYQPVIDDGRGRFPEDLRVKAPRAELEPPLLPLRSSSTPRIRNTSVRQFCAAWKQTALV
jgi:hypothetical protein